MAPPTDLAAQRREYSERGLNEQDVLADPLQQLQRWLDEAVKSQLLDATAFSVSTVSAQGIPSSRVVLLKGVDARGLVFFTRTSSQKGLEIAANPRVSLLFHWRELNRQVRIVGTATVTDREEAQSYFQTRPRNSRLTALVASGRTTVASREELERLFAEEDSAHPGEDIPMPEDWGGYRVTPSEFEFWQGRDSRLHDRLLYTPTDTGWTIRRLAP
jgi:pyridoxamine 5'-phosphate oxidase